MYLTLALGGIAAAAYGMSENRPMIMIVGLGAFVIGLIRMTIKHLRNGNGSR